MYTNDDAYEGMHNNIIAGAVSRYVAYTLDPFNPVQVSMGHTHPLSGPENEFSEGFGDEMLAKLPFLNNVYMADSQTGNMYVLNEDTPWNVKDPNYKGYEIGIITDGSLPHVGDTQK